MTNVNAPLPSRRRNTTGEAAHDTPVSLPKMTVPDRTITADEIGAMPVMTAATPPGSIAQPKSSGSARARALRETLRTPHGFFTAVQTAELLGVPVGLRPPSR